MNDQARSVAGLTHVEHMERAALAEPCAAWHITFGGRCLNCGWEPAVGIYPPSAPDDAPLDAQGRTPDEAAGRY